MPNIPRQISDVLEEFIIGVNKILGQRMKKIILYGSYARGDYKKNSDIDIMILTDFNDAELAEYRVKIRDLACDLELENNVVISPIVRNIEKYNERIDVIPFYMNVEKEGVVLHE